MKLSGGKMEKKDLPIGFFDSGLGGISVLKEAIKLMPEEDYIYYGDSKNAPYGTKEIKDVKELTLMGIDYLYKKGVKAIVVACNTATSVAINDIRLKYSDIPIIGIEPAIKPAIKCGHGGNILIMATPLTLAQSKFFNLIKEYNVEDKVISLPCEGLAEIIEGGILKGEIIKKYLNIKFKDIDVESIEAIVLGCTHYPFIKEEIENIISKEVPIIDGSIGTVNRLKSQLSLFNLRKDLGSRGRVEIFNSKGSSMLELSQILLNTV